MVGRWISEFPFWDAILLLGMVPPMLSEPIISTFWNPTSTSIWSGPLSALPLVSPLWQCIQNRDVKDRTQAELQWLAADVQRMWLKWLAHLYTYIYRDVHIILRYILIRTNNSTPDFCVPFRLKTPQLHLCFGGLVGARSPGALTPKLHLRCRGEFHPQ